MGLVLVPGVAVLFSSPSIGCKFVFFAWGGYEGKRGHAWFGSFCFFISEVLLCLSEQDLLLGSTMPLELTVETSHVRTSWDTDQAYGCKACFLQPLSIFQCAGNSWALFHFSRSQKEGAAKSLACTVGCDSLLPHAPLWIHHPQCHNFWCTGPFPLFAN